MFSRLLSKTAVRKIALLLTLLMALQPLLHAGTIRAESMGQVAAFNPVKSMEPASITADDLAQQSQHGGGTGGDPVRMAEALFDQVVRQAFQSQQWQVTALSNNLDWNSVQATDSGFAGIGGCQVDALDENSHSAHIEGELAFDLEAQAQAGSGLGQITGMDTLAGSTDVFTGTFKNSDAALSFTAQLLTTGSASSGTAPEGTRMSTESRFEVSLQRNGTTTQVVNSGTGNVEHPAYGLTRATGSGTLVRNGSTLDWRQATAVRDFGKGESEVWQEMDASQADGTPVSKLDQHGFQRIAGTAVSQYVDRFNLTTGGKSYKLDKPGPVTGTMNGDVTSNLVLVDGNGGSIELSNSKGGSRPPGLSSPPSQSGGAARGEGGISPGEAAVLIAAIGAGLLILGPGAAALLVLGEGGLAGEAVFAGAAIGGGAAAASIIRASNADPYFIVPDTRTNSYLAAPPLEITRVTGGLNSTPSLAAGASNVVTGTSATGTDATDLSASLDPTSGGPIYDDNPVPFVGGSLPKGAQPIGEWAWDHIRMYGAMPTHTQASSNGPELHYFTHAAQPLKLDENSNIVQYVYLDPADMPAEMYMQFYIGKGDGEHRAYWGEDCVQTGGTRGTASLYPMGALPAVGGWVRLQIPAGKLGLVGTEVNGILFGLYGGKAWWGPTTTNNYLLDNSPDVEGVDAPPDVPTTTLGTQIAYKLANQASISIEITDVQGKHVRTLQNSQQETGGYYVATWDAKDDNGTLVQDAPYSVRISIAGGVVAERAITVTPLVAHILTPGQDSLVRGDQVPVIAEAYGEHFSSYTLEYGAGISPQSWYTLTVSGSPTLLPTSRELRQFNPGNLANWDVGVNEFKPWTEEGLNGVYTLRLRVDGDDGREATDSTTVIVGRLAHTAEGGTITSPDGKARIEIPPLATSEPFALMALVPEAQLDPAGSWRSSLPTTATLASNVYEVFPAGEHFRQPATLELSANGGDTAHIGLMVGDGTPGGWRYIGGTYDPQKGVVSVSITGFGGRIGIALVALFTSTSFGQPRRGPVPPPDPSASARLQIAQAGQAPTITSAGVGTSGSLFAFYSDLESSPGEWAALDISGTMLSRVQGPTPEGPHADAGVEGTDSVLKVTRLGGGVRLVRVHSTPYDVASYPVLSFDYRLPDDYTPDLFVKSNGIWWQLSLGASPPLNNTYFKSVDAPKLVGDGSWHHYSVDLLALLQSVEPQDVSFQVSDIVLGQFAQTSYMQVEAEDSGQVGSSYYIDNFAALAPAPEGTRTNATSLNVSWTPPSGASFASYAYNLDADKSFAPVQQDQGAATSATVSLPQNLPDGLYYFHLAGKGADGTWGPATNLPILLDRSAPIPGTQAAPASGLDSSSIIQLPLTDLSGVVPASIQVKVGGQTYGTGSGLTYNPLLQSIEIMPNALKPPPTLSTSGISVEVTLLAASDHAGNKLSTPYTWSFTVDNPAASGAKFRQLTLHGGSSPALSPDGTLLAFVSARSGGQKIWLMKASDYEEKAGSPRPLTSANGSIEGDPAWSPDGQTLAYVSGASRSSQVWLAAPDGTGARALTTGTGGASSPTWLSDGETIVFVRDGNLWSVKADGGGLQPVTTYPERPIQSVRAQPRADGQLMAVGFKLYQETVEVYDMATGELRPLTQGGRDREPAWLNGDTLVYTALAGKQNGGEQQDAIWQVGAYGGSPETMADSGLPGVSDSGASTQVSDQNTAQNLLAIVSNRGGESNIWVRQSEQLSALEISPLAGAAPGEATKISYVLPTTATVTIDIESTNGAVVQSLPANIDQQAGVQQVEWDGTDSSGATVPEGNYTVKLSAKSADGNTLTRYASAHRSAAIGTLQVSVEEWAGQVVEADSSLRVEVYPAGTRTQPASVVESDSSPSVVLPVGRYDVVVEYKSLRQEVNGIEVGADTPAQVSVDLGLGTLEPNLLLSEGQSLSAPAYVAVSLADDPNRLAVQTGAAVNPSFALPPGRYDVRVEYGSVQIMARGVQVLRGQAARPDINLNSGILHLQVYARDGELAGAGGRLLVEAVDPRDHSKVLSVASTSNPADMPLPAGTYDIRVEYGTAASGQEGVVLGSVTSWLTGVTVQSGQTLTQDYNLRLTPVTIRLQEAQGKQAPGGMLTFEVYAADNAQELAAQHVAAALTDTARLELPEGTFSVVADYNGTQLRSSGPVGDPITVKYTGSPPGRQEIDRTIDLGLGHISVEVRDDQGQPVPASGLTAAAYPAGQRDKAFASAFNSNPLDLVVRAGQPYDVVLRLGDGRSANVPGQKVEEGKTLTLKLTPQEYK